MAAVNVWSKWTAFCNSWLALGYCILAERTAEPLAEYVFFVALRLTFTGLPFARFGP